MGSIDDTRALLDQVTWVRGLAGTLVVSPSDADDAAQEAWLQVLRRPPASEESPRGFLATVLRRTASKQRRSEQRRSKREDEVRTAEGSQVSTADLVARAELQQTLVDQVLALPEAQRDTVLLRFFEGLPPREIAARQGVPVATVRTRLQRGLQSMRERLEDSDLGKHWRDSLALAFFPAGIPTFVPSVAAATQASGLLGKTVMTMQMTKKSATLMGLLMSLGLGLPLSFAAGLFDADDPVQPSEVSALQSGSANERGATGVEAKEDEGAVSGRTSLERTELSNEADSGTDTDSVQAFRPGDAVSGRVVDLEGRGVQGVLVHWRTGSLPRFSDTVDDWIGDGDASVRMNAERWQLLEDPVRSEALFATRKDPAAWRAALAGRPTEGRSVQSLSDGTFELQVDPGAPADGDPHIVDPGFVEIGRTRNGDELTFVVAPALRIEGEVVDAAGRPVAGASVSIAPPESDERAAQLVESLPQFRTGSDGRFVLRSVPFVPGARLRATHVRLGRTEAPVSGAARQDLSLRLTEQDRSIVDLVGRVVDGRGEPIGGALVRFGRRTVRSEAETGDFRLSGPRRLDRVYVTAKGHRPGSASIGLASDPDASRTTVLVVLDGEPLKISGIVVDEDGQPIQGANVNTPDAEFPDSGFSSLEASTRGGMQVVTGPGGYFELTGLQEKSYRLRVYDLRDMGSLRYQITEPFEAGSELLRIVLPRLGNEARKLRVVDQYGDPIQGLEVRSGLTTVKPRHGWMGGTTPVLGLTDAEGAIGPIPVPVGFGFVQFESKELGQTLVPVDGLGDEVTIRRPLRVRLHAPEGARVDWVVFRKGLDEIEVRMKGGEERTLIRPVGGRFPLCLVPEDVTHLEWFDGREIRGMALSLRSGARNEDQEIRLTAR